MLVFRSPEKAGKTGYCLASNLWENITEMGALIPVARIRTGQEDKEILDMGMAQIMQRQKFTASGPRKIKDVAKESDRSYHSQNIDESNWKIFLFGSFFLITCILKKHYYIISVINILMINNAHLFENSIS